MAKKPATPPARGGGGPEPDGVPGGGTESDPLREEAERGWAESDRKAAKGRRRSEARAKRHGKAKE